MLGVRLILITAIVASSAVQADATGAPSRRMTTAHVLNAVGKRVVMAWVNPAGSRSTKQDGTPSGREGAVLEDDGETNAQLKALLWVDTAAEAGVLAPRLDCRRFEGSPWGATSRSLVSRVMRC